LNTHAFPRLRQKSGLEFFSHRNDDFEQQSEEKTGDGPLVTVPGGIKPDISFFPPRLPDSHNNPMNELYPPRMQLIDTPDHSCKKPGADSEWNYPIPKGDGHEEKPFETIGHDDAHHRTVHVGSPRM
jgi:hypothetical protein